MPQSLGARLRRAREDAGRPLADVAMRTRVSERHLVAIEEGRFTDFASRTYAVGFARAYARDVGLDEHAVADEVRAELARHGDGERARTVTFDYGDPARVPGRGLAWAAALVAGAVVVGVFFWWRSYLEPAAPLDAIAPPAAQAPIARPSATPGAAPAPPSAPPSGGPVVFTATQPSVWVKFYDAAGKQLMQSVMAKGQSYTVPADAAGPKLWTGRPEVLAITIGGRPVPQISTKAGRVKDVPVDAASLLKRPPVPGPVLLAPPATPASPAPSSAAAIPGAAPAG